MKPFPFFERKRETDRATRSESREQDVGCGVDRSSGARPCAQLVVVAELAFEIKYRTNTYIHTRISSDWCRACGVCGFSFSFFVFFFSVNSVSVTCVCGKPRPAPRPVCVSTIASSKYKSLTEIRAQSSPSAVMLAAVCTLHTVYDAWYEVYEQCMRDEGFDPTFHS